MLKVKKWSEFITERNNNKIIYHFTENLDSLSSILFDDSLQSGSYNKLYGRGYENISFTWNPNLWDIEYAGDEYDRYTVRIALDYSKISKDFEFKPFDYGIPEEQEEIVETEEINDISSYIIEIAISSQENKMEIDNLKKSYSNLKFKIIRRKPFNKRF